MNVALLRRTLVLHTIIEQFEMQHPDLSAVLFVLYSIKANNKNREKIN
jgi:hypothetical protein